MTTGKDGTDRIVITARTYTAKFRDGSGIVREVATGCRDESAARSVLGGPGTPGRTGQGRVAHRRGRRRYRPPGTRPLAEHFAAYLDHQEAEGTSPAHRENVNRCLRRLAADCGFPAGRSDAEALERWLVAQGRWGMGARPATRIAGPWWPSATGASTRPALGQSFCRPSRRLTTKPVAGNVGLTEDELVRLLDVARRRPLLDAMTSTGEAKRRSVRRTAGGNPPPVGTARAGTGPIYKTLVLTGLRKGELASLTVGQVVLDAARPTWCLTRPTKRTGRDRRFPFGPILPPIFENGLPTRRRPPGSRPNVPAVQFDPKAGTGETPPGRFYGALRGNLVE